ncbi:MAG: PD-(D/E)XK nuclease family protein [Magnetococcus sp. MYC-9]
MPTPASGMAKPMMDILKSLDPESLILTVNRRLARTLTRLADQQQRAAGAAAWPTPRILPWESWLEQCWEQILDHRELPSAPTAADTPRLLNPWQERLLWERIIAASPAGESLLQVAEAAKTAQQAWQLLQQWRLTLTDADLYDHEDAQVFYAWSNQFASLCRKRGWLERAGLPRFLRRQLHMEGGAPLRLPKRIWLAGFQRHTPDMQALLEALAPFELTMAPLAIPGQAGQAVRCGWSSSEAELLAAARWSRSLLAQSPEVSIGIVVPDLEQRLPQVVGLFARVLYPGANPSRLDPRSKIFNLSLGAPLTATPLIRDALLLLGMATGTLSRPRYSALLHSPFWRGGQEEWSARSLLDDRLREQGLLQIRTRQLRREATRGDRHAPPCPILAATLNTFLHHLFPTGPAEGGDGQPATSLAPASPSLWMERFSRWLALLGWPGEGPLSSGEFQNISAWRQALSLFATLDPTSGPLSLTAALELLERILAESPFQPEADTAPIQIMGLLEAVGERFTHLWVCGLSAETWPPAVQANPLLPIDLQRRHGMPHATFTQESTYHQELLQALLESAGVVVCSHPASRDDQPLHPSPMIIALPEADPCAPADGEADPPLSEGIDDYNAILFDSAHTKTLRDDLAPPWMPANGAKVGSGVLKAQALCPFQAFARYRLGARPRMEPQPGLDPAQRGQIVHSALTQLWQQLGQGQADLRRQSSTDNPVVKAAVHVALEEAARQWPDPLHPFLRQLEEVRLNRLLTAFLELEKERPVPFTVQKQEQKQTLTLGRLTLNLRLDRLDRLADDTLVILDYKTGASQVKEWFGDRPRDPQLPLYLLALADSAPQKVAALAFCQLKAGTCQFAGLAKEEGLLPNVPHFQRWAPDCADWQSLIDRWRRVLTALGEAFLRGEAAVDPLPQVCQLCDLSPLCRRHERLPLPEEEEERA